MRILSRSTVLPAVVALLSMIIPAVAGDSGNPKDVEQVRKAVPKKLGKVLHISVSHDWALCTTYAGEDSLSVALHRTGPDWKVVTSDGGAFAADDLKKLGVPTAEIAALLKVYQ